MASQVKVSGSWKNVSAAQVKVGGVWKTVASGHVKVGGVWKQFYSSGPFTNLGGNAPYLNRSAMTNGYVYFVGDGGDTNNYQYNISNNTFTQKANRIETSTANGLAGAQGYIMTFGGYFGGSFRQNSYRYQISTNTWSQMANFPYNADGIGAATSNFSGQERTYTSGSWGNSGCQSYNPSTNTFTSMASLPYARSYSTAVGTTQGIYQMGTGYNHQTGAADQKLFQYTGSSNTWTERATMPTTGLYTAGSIRPKIFSGTTLYEWNPSTNAWVTVLTNAPIAPSYQGYTLTDTMYFFAQPTYKYVSATN
jgi:hypothetical protein